MLKRLKDFSKFYFSSGMSFLGLESSLTFPIIDFDRSWIRPITSRPALWILILSGRIFTSIFLTLVPLLVGYAFKAQSSYHFVVLTFIWFIIESWRYFTIFLFNIEQSRLSYAINYSAYRFFLSVDPIYHAMRTSGRLFAKIRRGSNAYEDLLNVFTYELLSIFVSIVTVISSLFVLDSTVGWISFGFLFLLGAFNIAAILFNAIAFEIPLIKADDDMKSVSMESLVQIELVRSSFATCELDRNIFSKARRSASILATHWISFATAMFFTRVGYGISVALLGIYILSMIKSGAISVVMGTSFLVTYVHGSYRIMRVGEKSQKILRCIIRVKDLFKFIQDFGLQTFPVFAGESPVCKIPEVDKISVKAVDLHFAYTKKAQIFEEHNLDLSVLRSQKNKLYGIIGPSGVGKTTLVSILGGQLRPTTGTILINGVPMYEIDDEARRHLVAMQGQTASNLSGMLRDSLLIGLPKDPELFSDDVLVTILERVGLWKIFDEKEGLDSSVGEGGFNLSVGQRQRLNFASLYLRTMYFKPSLILIDEPTSSLDEVSEQAITDMIDELARGAVIFVIAHRLNTLEKAVGILDVSLLADDKELIFYSREELIEKSYYYQKLIKGEVAIEE